MIEIKLAECPFCHQPATWCGNDLEEPHDCHIIRCQSCDTTFEMLAEGGVPNSLHELQKLCANKFNQRKGIH